MSTNANASFSDLIRDWESLLGACQENEYQLGGITPLVEPLGDILIQVKVLKTQQETLDGKRQLTTQQILQLCEDGREAARRVRNFVKSRLGSKNEQLPSFGISPIRRRSQRRPDAELPPPPQPE